MSRDEPCATSRIGRLHVRTRPAAVAVVRARCSSAMRDAPSETPPRPATERPCPTAARSPTPGASTRLDPYVDRYAARTAGHDRLRDPRAVRGGLAARGGLARRRHAEHLRPAARRGRRARSATWSRPAGPVALQYGSGQGDPTLREQICEVMRARGHRGAPRRRGGHGRLPAGGRPGHPDLLRPRRRGDLRGAVVRRRARRLPAYQCDVVHVAMDDRRAGARGAARRRSRAAGRRADDQVPLHDPQLPQPGRRHPAPRAAAGDPARSAARRDVLVLEDNPYGLLGFDGEPHAARCAPTRPTA